MKNTKTIPDGSKVIQLRAVDENWTFYFTHTSSKKIQIIEHKPFQLECSADFNKIDFKTVIEKWLKKYSKAHLIPWIEDVSQQTGLKYQRVSIRGQRTRWGSCSADQSISLNYKLLFLPRKLVHHLLLHELCHTIYLDHSVNFWQLLASYDNHWCETKLNCRKAHHYIPSWLER